jgi:hypothetical protein
MLGADGDRVHCWLQVLRYASPRTVARAACVCRELAVAAALHRSLDVSCGAEELAVLAPSAGDAAFLKGDFAYCATYFGFDEADLCGGGCDCVACLPSCPCAALDRECGPACCCGPSCLHRRTQQGVRVPLLLRHDVRGWGVVSGSRLALGDFVCVYAGELISGCEARRRQAANDEAGKPNYVMAVHEHGTSLVLVTHIDPSCCGNVGRFLNHECGGGNLELRLVRAAGWPLPRAAFFTRRPISAGEELTYSYGAGAGRTPCLCGAVACCGWLPCER